MLFDISKSLLPALKRMFGKKKKRGRPKGSKNKSVGKK
jgi:hypothetical protein|tara:strand:- start:93 stop:206 length:114 start_codon:yes stop_codon:yes gene_type:complete